MPELNFQIIEICMCFGLFLSKQNKKNIFLKRTFLLQTDILSLYANITLFSKIINFF